MVSRPLESRANTDSPSEPAIDWLDRRIRVTEVRADGFVAFDFLVGGSDLYVEMILSPEAFTDFCANQGIEPEYGLPAEAANGEFPDIHLSEAIRLCNRGLRPDGTARTN